MAQRVRRGTSGGRHAFSRRAGGFAGKARRELVWASHRDGRRALDSHDTTARALAEGRTQRGALVKIGLKTFNIKMLLCALWQWRPAQSVCAARRVRCLPIRLPGWNDRPLTKSVPKTTVIIPDRVPLGPLRLRGARTVRD